MEYAQQIDASVTADDPGSAIVKRQSDIEIVYPTETVSITAKNKVARDQAQASTVVTIDGRTIFDETWNRF